MEEMEATQDAQDETCEDEYKFDLSSFVDQAGKRGLVVGLWLLDLIIFGINVVRVSSEPATNFAMVQFVFFGLMTVVALFATCALVFSFFGWLAGSIIEALYDEGVDVDVDDDDDEAEDEPQS